MVATSRGRGEINLSREELPRQSVETVVGGTKWHPFFPPSGGRQRPEAKIQSLPRRELPGSQWRLSRGGTKGNPREADECAAPQEGLQLTATAKEGSTFSRAESAENGDPGAKTLPVAAAALPRGEEACCGHPSAAGEAAWVCDWPGPRETRSMQAEAENEGRTRRMGRT
jgi:hypothetical protein